MQLGIGLPSFSSDTHALPPDRFRRYVRLADEYGFAGAWVIEHLGENPNYATSLLDPLVTLAYAAGETETLPVGTSVLLLPLRNPVLVAKRAATLQYLAGRRLTLGLGAGYVEAEFDAAGVPMAERSARYLEGIELVRELLTGKEVTFDGDFYSVENFRLEPTLGQPPRLLAGGSGTEGSDGRVVAEGVKSRFLHADGWIAPPRSLAAVASDWDTLAEFLRSRGRDPGSLDKVALQYLHLVPGDDETAVRREQRTVYGRIVGSERSVESAFDRWLSGTVDDVRETLAEYERLGFDEVILYPTSPIPHELDRQLRLFREYLLAEYP